jgi:SAM-dependent methyltransferase
MPMRNDDSSPDYWDRVGRDIEGVKAYRSPLLGRVKRAAYLALVWDWGGAAPGGRALKTDLFEEALGQEAFLDELGPGGERRVGMDISRATARRAKLGGKGGSSSFVVADVRRLPFAAASFGLVVSPSTLDHFKSASDLHRSLEEIFRIMAPAGTLIVTLDNRQNVFDPLLRLLSRLGLTPFYLGRSYSVNGLCSELRKAGFVVAETTAIVHNPRLLAAAASYVAERLGWEPLRDLVRRTFVSAQRLEKTRWCFRTGSFIAARAVRPRDRSDPVLR